MSELIFDHVSLAIGSRTIVHDASLRLGAGELVALVGPNGAGKTTLLRAGLGLSKPQSGKIYLDQSPIGQFKPQHIARKIAYLPQSRTLAWPLRVEDVVRLGRFAYGQPLSRQSQADEAALARALSACDLTAFVGRNTDTLSGGELARVHIARALVAETPLLIADEPNAALDPRHAHEMMAIIKTYCQKGGGALVSLHDLSLASRFADRVIVLHQGRVFADGPPQIALSTQTLSAVFGMRGRVMDSVLYVQAPLDQ